MGNLDRWTLFMDEQMTGVMRSTRLNKKRKLALMIFPFISAFSMKKKRFTVVIYQRWQSTPPPTFERDISSAAFIEINQPLSYKKE